MQYRIEKDSLGNVEVPVDKYWGAQTQRSLENFKIGEILMPTEIIEAMAIVKKAAALSNNGLNVLSKEKTDIIVKVCDEIIAGKLSEHFPLVVWQTGSGTQTNMNINEVIANRSQILLGNNLGEGKTFIHPNDDVNKSQSTNDVFPTAIHIATYKMIVKKMLPSIEVLKNGLAEKSDEFKDIIKTGRTHLMDATPLTLGQEFSGFAAQLEHGIKAIKNTLAHLSELAIGGTAVGSGINAPVNYDTMMASKIAELTDLPFINAHNKFEAISTQDALVETSGALKTLAVSLMHIANNIRLLNSGPRCGIGEIILPTNEPGSSIMPGKINPTQAEALSMVAAQVIGNDTAINIGGMSGHFQLNAFMPLMAYNMLFSIKIIADACLSFHNKCVVGIKPNINVISNNLDNSLMLATALNTHIGYDNAAKIAKKAYEEGKTLKEAAVETGLLTAEQFDEWVNPNKMI